MSLDDALGVGADDNSTIPPQSILNDLITQRMPGIADQQGNVDPQSVLNRLIRHGMERSRAPAPQVAPQGTSPAPDFSQFGDENGAPPMDFAQFGEEDPNAVAKRDRGAVSAFGRSAASGAIKGAGATAKGLGEMMLQQGAAEADTMGVPAEQAEAMRSHEAMTENPLAKAGERVQKYGETIAPTEAEQQKHWLASGVGNIAGGVAAPIALGIADPVAGIAAGAAMFGLSGYADTYDEALKHGASEATAQGAAGLAGAVLAVTGGAPIAQVLTPVKAYLKVLPEAPGVVMRILGQAAESGIVFTGVGEAQEYIGQQIAKMYDPNAGYDPSWQRMASEFVAGAILGGAHQGLHEAFGKGEQQQPQPTQQTGPEAQQPGTETQPPGPQPQPGTGPERGLPPGGEQQQGPQGAPGEAPGGPQAAPEKPQPFASTMAKKVREKLEDKAAYYKEFSPDIIKSWSDDELKDYVTRKFGGGTARPSDEEILRESGVPDEDIAGMSPEQRKRPRTMRSPRVRCTPRAVLRGAARRRLI